MKKFLTAICSFALILFMGLAVGCATTDAARVRFTLNSTAKYTLSGSSTKTIKAKTPDDNSLSGDGVSFTLSKDNTYGKDYTATFDDIATSCTITVGTGTTVTAKNAVSFDDQGKLQVTITSASSITTGTTLCKITIAAATSNEKKISSFETTTYTIVFELAAE